MGIGVTIQRSSVQSLAILLPCNNLRQVVHMAVMPYGLKGLVSGGHALQTYKVYPPFHLRVQWPSKGDEHPAIGLVSFSLDIHCG